MVVRGSVWEAASCTSRSGTPASRAAVMNACRSVCGRIFWPARRATRADDPPGAVPVQPVPSRGSENGFFTAFADCEIDSVGGARSERGHRFLAAFAGNGQGAVAAVVAVRSDGGAGGYRDQQPVQREQRDQGMLGRCAQTGNQQAPTSLRSRLVSWDS